MTLRDIYEWDKRTFVRMKKFQLPNKFKRIGLIVFFGLLITSMTLKYFDARPEWLKPLLKNAMLLGFLAVSLSKEKIEDELVVVLRAQSYRLAFVIGVLYAIVQPYIDYAFDLVTGSNSPEIEMSSFQVILYMIFIQLMFFHLMLKKCR